MGLMKKIYSSCYDGENVLIQSKTTNVSGNSLTFKKYVKNNCLFLIADVKKIEKEYCLDLKHILVYSLIYCFKKEIKKPRAKLNKNNIVQLYSQKHNYTISLKHYFL